MVIWGDNGAGGFGSPEAAEHFIERVCKVTAPEKDYGWALEF